MLNRDCRVGNATIGMPATFQVENRRSGVRVGKHIRRCLVNGGSTRAELAVDGLSGMQGERIEMIKVRHHSDLFECLV